MKNHLKIFLSILVVALLLGAGYWYLQTDNESANTLTESAIPTPVTDLVAPDLDQKTYTNTTFGFALELPRSVETDEVNGGMVGSLTQDTFFLYLKDPNIAWDAVLTVGQAAELDAGPDTKLVATSTILLATKISAEKTVISDTVDRLGNREERVVVGFQYKNQWYRIIADYTTASQRNMTEVLLAGFRPAP